MCVQTSSDCEVSVNKRFRRVSFVRCCEILSVGSFGCCLAHFVFEIGVGILDKLWGVVDKSFLLCTDEVGVVPDGAIRLPRSFVCLIA